MSKMTGGVFSLTPSHPGICKMCVRKARVYFDKVFQASWCEDCFMMIHTRTKKAKQRLAAFMLRRSRTPKGKKIGAHGRRRASLRSRGRWNKRKDSLATELMKDAM